MTSESPERKARHSLAASGGSVPGRRHLDLFSGIGGFALAARWTGWKTIGFAETDDYANQILKRHWPDVPNHGDVRNVRGVGCDLITGGFPCQPYSTAGKRNGESDARALWPEMLRIVGESRPAWVLGENVTGFASVALDAMLDALENLGYSCRTFDIPAASLGAWHKRSRLWIVAHADGGRRDAQPLRCASAHAGNCADDADGAGATQRGQETWMAEPAMERVVYGLSRKLDKQRVKALGNSIVPQVASVIMAAMARTQNA